MRYFPDAVIFSKTLPDGAMLSGACAVKGGGRSFNFFARGLPAQVSGNDSTLCVGGRGNSLTGVIPARGRHRGGSGDLPAGAAQHVSVQGGLRRTFPGVYISLKNAPPDGVVQFGGAYAGNRIICRGVPRLFRRGPRRAGSWRRSYPVRRSGSSTECPVRRNPWPPGCRNAAVR